MDAAEVFHPNSFTACFVDRFFPARFSAPDSARQQKASGFIGSLLQIQDHVTQRGPGLAAFHLALRQYLYGGIEGFKTRQPVPLPPPFLIAAAVSAISDEPNFAPAASVDIPVGFTGSRPKLV
jgi:hypothetical protein